MSDAVVTGISTVLADDPQLTCRLPGMPSPARVVLDSRLRLPLASKLVTTMGLAPLWVFAGPPASAEREQALAAHGVEVHRVEESTDGLGLAMVLSLLAQRGITRMMLEAGPKLTTAFLAANLIDELALFRSPIPIGEEGTDALEGLPLSALLSSAPLQHIATETIGPDLLEFYERT
jgi:diaminohydroxyphosphoribosylaminopyrimidine deaminase / 5-amino-6-(5-phosphoribosylamino)uracil reductase